MTVKGLTKDRCKFSFACNDSFISCDFCFVSLALGQHCNSSVFFSLPHIIAFTVFVRFAERCFIMYVCKWTDSPKNCVRNDSVINWLFTNWVVCKESCEVATHEGTSPCDQSLRPVPSCVATLIDVSSVPGSKSAPADLSFIPWPQVRFRLLWIQLIEKAFDQICCVGNSRNVVLHFVKAFVFLIFYYR